MYVQYQNFNRRFEVVKCLKKQEACSKHKKVARRIESCSKSEKLLKKLAEQLMDSPKPVVRYWLTVSNNLGWVCALLCQVYWRLKMCRWRLLLC